MRDDFVAEVRRALAARGLSASRAAVDAGLPQRAIHNVLSGVRPSVDRAAEIANALGLEFYIGPPRDGRDHGIGAVVPGSRLQVAPAADAELRRALEAAEQAGVDLAARAAEVMRQLGAEEFVAVPPVVGRVVAGVPVEAEEREDGWVPFPASWADGGSCFALQVAGDSMMLAGILDGDTAIVRRQETARSGQIVAATVEGETTLKRYLAEGDTRLLVAENVGYPPIDISAKGVVVRTAASSACCEPTSDSPAR